MKRMLQTASRGAMIALLATTPVIVFAQSEGSTDSGEVLMTKPKASAEASVTQETGGSTEMADTADAIEEDAEEAVETAEEELTPTEDGADTEMAADEAAPVEEDTEMATDETAPLEDETEMATDGAAATDEQMQMAEADDAQPVEGQIIMQDANTVLAEDLLGSAVFNDSDENVGDINDLIIGLDGSVKGVIIGVGGFLGLGEKDVAVEMAALEVVDAMGNPRIITSASKEDLEAAPEFASAAARTSASQMESTGTMGGTAQPTE